MFCRPLQASQCVSRTSNEEPAEYALNQPAPPPWRELERSVECHSTGVAAYRCNLNDLVVRDAERQADGKGEAPRSNGLLYVKNHLHATTNASAEHEAISGTQLPIRCLDDPGVRPARQRGRRGHELPDALGWCVDDVRWANV